MPFESDSAAAERQNMVEAQLRSRGIRDEAVLAAMARVPRHEFIPAEFRDRSYGDHPIPIAENQTVSQPYIVAVMLEALRLQPSQTVLEIGTGSGYQTALLAELSAHVYSMERHASLAASAQETLTRLLYSNVTIVVGDGSKGLPEHAPYSAVIVSAAAAEIPPALFGQLAEAGRMLIPVGPPDAQQLQLVQKQQGNPVVTTLENCRFVPLISG